MAAFTPPSVRATGLRRKKLWLWLIAGGAAVIVGVGGWQVVNLLTATCGGGTSSYQGECVGATDGSRTPKRRPPGTTCRSRCSPR